MLHLNWSSVNNKIRFIMGVVTTVIVIYFYFFFTFAFVVFKFVSPNELPSFVKSLMFPLYLSILMTLYIYYENKLTSKIENFYLLIKLKELYPIAPLFIISVGVSFTLLSLVFSSKFLVYSGFTFILFGLILFVIAILAKSSLEQRIYFNLKEANSIIKKIDESNKNPAEIYNLKRYMRLTFEDVNNKLDKGLELRSCEDTNTCYKLEYALINYLPYYIKFGGKEQLDSTKHHFEAMLKSVNENDEIKWKSFTSEVMSLNEEITTYLKGINFHLTYRKWSRNLEWILTNKDTIFKVVGLIVAAIISLTLKIPLGT